VPRNRYNRIVYFNQKKVELKDYLAYGNPPSDKGKPGETVDVMTAKILAALKKTHHFFPDLLALFPSSDYRTIATAVGKLHQEGKIIQDGEGKYQMRELAS
jgi:2,5-furandicarboxylate decarboxylase 1